MKKLLSMVLALAMVCSLFVPAMAAEKAPWYAEAVSYALDKGLMENTADDTFSPAQNADRGAVIRALYHAAGKPAAGQDKAAFNDLAGQPYADAAHWAGFTGIVKGKDDGGFHGEDSITRQELAVMLGGYMQVMDMTTVKAALSKVTDKDAVASWAADGMGYAIGAGLIKGTTGNLTKPTVNPTGTITRAELAQVLHNLSRLTPAAPAGTVPAPVEAKVATIDKYGNTYLDVLSVNLLAAGYRPGDVLTVTVGEHTLEMPFCTNYSDVDNGSVVAVNAASASCAYLDLAVNMGNFSKTYGCALGDTVKIELKEAGGYKAQYEARQLERTYDRADYASDAVYANFREFTLGGIAPGVLYRTGSPINPELSRASYADALIKKAGVKTVLNLADANTDIDRYIAADTFASPYYKGLYESGSVIALSMGVDATAPEFAVKLKQGLEFMLAHEAPYAFHCTEGKDRAGFVAILFEALMGATVEEIKTDYIISFENYFHVEKGTEQHKLIANIAEGNLCTIAALPKGSDLSKADLAKAAADYLVRIGLTAKQVDDLKAALSVSPAGSE